jgi:acyl-CoA reductase-like NAD-dependent aldehyde dehydrogenase
MLDGIKPQWQNFINGEWVDGSNSSNITIENPATGEAICQVAEASQKDVDDAVIAAKVCYESGELSKLTPPQRFTMMMHVAQHLRSNIEKIAHIVVIDTGKRILDAIAHLAFLHRLYLGIIHSLLQHAL